MMETYVDKDAPVILGLDLQSRARMAFERWKTGGGCVYLCWICQDGSKTFGNSVALKVHLKEDHNISVTEHRDLYGTPRVVTNKIVCKLCKNNRRIVYEGRHLERHFRQEHRGTSMMEYFLHHIYTEVSGKWNPLSEREQILKRWMGTDKENKLVKAKEIEDSLVNMSLDKEDIENPMCNKKMMRTRLSWSDGSIEPNNETTLPKISLDDTQPNDDSVNVTRKFANLCRFRCKLCDFERNGRFNIIYHSKICHPKEYTGKKRDLFKHVYQRIKTTWHLCHVCDKKILCEKIDICGHARTVHGLSATQYGSIAEKVEEKSVGTATNEIANLCRFRCRICGFEVGCHLKIIAHSKSNHYQEHVLVKIKGETRTYERISTSWHHCKVCSKRILCDLLAIRNHVYQKHKLTMSAYRCKFLTLKENVGNPKTKTKKILSKMPRRNPLRNFSTDAMLEAESSQEAVSKATKASKPKIGNTLSEVQKIFPLESTSKDKCSEETESPKEAREVTTTQVADLCWYRCNYCDFEDRSRKDMACHYRSKHSQEHPEIWGANQKIYQRISTTWHLCLVCNKKIPCDKDAIFAHIRHKHGLTLASYGSGETTTKVANLCQYTCKLCSYNAQSLGIIKFHSKTVHTEELKGNSKVSNTYERTKTVWHQCFLCQQKVLCDRNTISLHTNKKHKLLLHDYITKMEEDPMSDSSLPKIESYQSI